MGLLAEAAGVLSHRAGAFVPASDQLEAGVTDSWTLRDALVVASQCDRNVGPFAYWEHREINGSINAAWELLSEHLGVADPQSWSNAHGRTVKDVLGVLSTVTEVADVPLGPTPTLRPWCDTRLIRTCRIPFVPLAALIHAWSAGGGTLDELLRRFGIDENTDPWEILDWVEPTIGSTQGRVDTVAVARTADYLREQMRNADPEEHSPARFLTKLPPDLLLSELIDMSVNAQAEAGQ